MTRLAVAISLLSLNAAWAQADGGTPKAAPAAKASPMAKALGSAKEEDEPLPPKPAAGPSQNEVDAALLRAVLYAFEPAPTEIRVIAIEDLGILGDPRALNPLAQLVMDANPNVQLAALRAIAAIQHPRAEAILSNIVRHPTINERVKMSAIDALVFQNSPTSIAFLNFVGRGGNFHPTLSSQARRVLLELPSSQGRTL